MKMYACSHECIDKYRWFVATILKHAHMLFKLQETCYRFRSKKSAVYEQNNQTSMKMCCVCC